jgi:Domain of unknown function (DUF4262)
MEEDPLEQVILDNVAKYGWHINAIPEDDEGPAFAYSIGMLQTLGHPDIIMIGQKIKTMHGIINYIGGLIREGQRFEDGGVYPGILVGYKAAFRRVALEHYAEYLGYARWFYKRDDFPMLQCVWPSRSGYFPWEDDVPEDFSTHQPVLATPPDKAPPSND